MTDVAMASVVGVGRLWYLGIMFPSPIAGFKVDHVFPVADGALR